MVERMRAVRQHRFGDPDVLRVEEVDRPEPDATEILVRVHAAGINPVDRLTRAGEGLDLTPPFTLGWEVSGVVAEVARGVTRFGVGDEVYGMPRFPHLAGGHAEYVTAPARHFAAKPANLDHVAAAAVPLPGLTAYQALVDTAELSAGQRVLVHAAAGGVGHLAVQVARDLGGHVIGTARREWHDLVRELGADEVVDYTEVDFAEVVRDVDVVIDLVGGEYGGRSLRTLRPGGLLVGLSRGVGDEVVAEAERRGLRAVSMLVEPDHAGLRWLTDRIEAGRLVPRVARAFPLERAADAHRLGDAGTVKGRIVLTAT